MPVVQNPFGVAGSDAGWPYVQARWRGYEISAAVYNDTLSPPQTLNPQIGRVIRNLFANSLGKNQSPLYGLWADAVYYEYRRRVGSYPTIIPNLIPATYANIGTKIYAYDLNRAKDLIETDPPALGTAGYLDLTGTQTRNGYYDGNNTFIRFVQAYGYRSGFAGVSVSGKIYAQNVNDLIEKFISANNVCICNCNYCTCNCNYCTCNCNYACTCNCNYSDERVKTNIEYL
jgi:hypothetical protein